MKISDLSIRRPVFASMVSLALVLFGAIGYTRLAVREFPDVDPPIVSVVTELPGANPQVVESAVTDILEEELSTVEGLRTLSSSSAEGFSNITVKAQVPNPRRELQAGMFIEVRLATAVRANAVVVPEDAVLPLQGATYWVVAGQKATRRQVDLGVRSPGFVEVKTGVDAGEQVVVGGQERLAEGAPVAPKVVERIPPSGPGRDSGARAGES
jgi:hypothetical protein